MKRMLCWLSAGAMIALLVPGLALSAPPMNVKIGKGEAAVAILEGSAQVLPQGRTAWQGLEKGSALRGGDEVSVGKGARMELVLADASKLRFAGNTRFRLVAAGANQAGDVRVHVAVGKAWAKASKAIGVKRKFEISCDNAIAGVRGTVYRMNVDDDKSALVRVYTGEVAVGPPIRAMGEDRTEAIFGKTPTKVSGPTPIAGPTKITMEEWVVLLKSMQQVTISAAGVAGKPREFTEQEDRDEWVDWNKARDQAE